MAVNDNAAKKQLQVHVERDRRYATHVRTAADSEMAKSIGVAPELRANSEFVGWKQDQLSSLRAIKTSPFFARVDTKISSPRHGTEKTTYLISSCRGAVLLAEDDWEIISWTSPVTAQLLDKEIGVSFDSGNSKFVIGESGRFSKVVPDLKDLHYRLECGTFRLTDPAAIEGPLELLGQPEEPSTEYEAPESFELGEIIELADSTQRTAMHLPFDESVIVEGPPGSGKTSIGIMRIPCLIDRQWEELDLNPQTQPEFHSAKSMRILVFNDEMVSYLDSLTRSLGVHGVPVSTLGDFFLQVCRDAKTLSGRTVFDSEELAYIKAHPLALNAFWSGFKQHINTLWTERKEEFNQKFSELGTLGVSLCKGLEAWVEQVLKSDVVDGEVPSLVNLASRSGTWHQRALTTIPEKITLGPRASFAQQRVVEEREVEIRDRKKLIDSIIKILKEFSAAVLARHASANAMFETGEYDQLLQACINEGMDEGSVEEASKQWLDQYQSKRPRFSEYDMTLAAWLGVHVSLAPSSGPKPVIGSQLASLTHIVVDEAQDVSATHAAVLRKLIDRQGTMTFVGDLNQHLKIAGGLRAWSDLGLPDAKRAVFNMNYRQTFELGQFVRKLHEELFGIVPVWEASPKRIGPNPRVRQCGPSLNDMVLRISEEISYWRDETARCTVGVLFDGQVDVDELEIFQESIEEAIEELLVPVYLIRPDSRDRAILKTDCVVIAPVEATKGLEFDSVVLLDNSGMEPSETPGASRRRQNGFYVAASRARQGLSICTPSPMECMKEFVI